MGMYTSALGFDFPRKHKHPGRHDTYDRMVIAKRTASQAEGKRDVGGKSAPPDE
jgi:hypothetical protein